MVQKWPKSGQKWPKLPQNRRNKSRGSPQKIPTNPQKYRKNGQKRSHSAIWKCTKTVKMAKNRQKSAKIIGKIDFSYNNFPKKGHFLKEMHKKQSCLRWKKVKKFAPSARHHPPGCYTDLPQRWFCPSTIPKPVANPLVWRRSRLLRGSGRAIKNGQKSTKIGKNYEKNRFSLQQLPKKGHFLKEMHQKIYFSPSAEKKEYFFAEGEIYIFGAFFGRKWPFWRSCCRKNQFFL